MYVDIDVHHGDGVEEAFYENSRVMTLSIHQYDEVEKFFPGTGSLDSIGENHGKYSSVNIPLRKGCDDFSFILLFDSIFNKCFEAFRPSVIWIQCGADSLYNDIIGRFKLSTKAHGHAVKTVLSKKVPTVLVGGGGYTIENVSRCWAYEASLAGNVELPEKLPKSLYFYDYYKLDKNLHFGDGNFNLDANQPEWVPNKEGHKSYINYLDKGSFERVQETIFKNLNKLQTLSYGT